jgi:plastocyanin
MSRLLVVALAALASVSLTVLGFAQEEIQVGVGTPVSWTVAGTPAHTANTVAIVNDPVEFFVFMPNDVTVPVGGTVIWENQTGATHSVISTTTGEMLMAETDPTLTNGQSYSHTFETADVDVTYKCGVHEEMTGTVHVEA